jgi:prepilin-type N-terminal cleavage/methylation domain-containing protein
MTKVTPRSQCRGLSLVEVMIALSIGLALLLGGYAALQTAEYQFIDAQQRVDQHDQTLLAVTLLQRAVEESGLAPFGNIEAPDYLINLFDDPSRRIHFPSSSVMIFTEKDASLLHAWGLDKPGSGAWLKSSDVLVTYQLSAEETVVQKANPRSTNITLQDSLQLQAGDILVLTNTQHQIIDQVTAVSGRTVTLEKPLSMGLSAGTRVNRLQWTAYYVGDTTRQNQGKSVTGFYAQDLSGIRYEVVPDITPLSLAIESGVLHVNMGDTVWRMVVHS